MSKYKYGLSEDRIEQVLKSLQGLTKNQWGIVKGAVDYVYNAKAAKVKVDSLEELEIVKDLLKL